MNSYIVERSKKMPFHTDMSRVFEALQGKQKDYNWLITYNEHYGALSSADDETLPDDVNASEVSNYSIERFNHDIVWITGEELTKIINANTIQFVWGVFSGFRPEIDINPDDLIVEPYADGNPDFWVSDPKIQHPLANIEIVCWDSSLTLFLSEYEELGNNFKQYFDDDATDLKEYNSKSLK